MCVHRREYSPMACGAYIKKQQPQCGCCQSVLLSQLHRAAEIINCRVPEIGHLGTYPGTDIPTMLLTDKNNFICFHIRAGHFNICQRTARHQVDEEGVSFAQGLSFCQCTGSGKNLIE